MQEQTQMQGTTLLHMHDTSHADYTSPQKQKCSAFEVDYYSFYLRIHKIHIIHIIISYACYVPLFFESVSTPW